MTADLDALDPAVAAMSARYQALLDDRASTPAPTPATAARDEAPPSVATLADWGVLELDAQTLTSPAFHETEAVAHVRAFLAEARGGVVKVLVLSGAMGAGKTIAGCWAMIAARPVLHAGRDWAAERHPRIVTAVTLARWGQFGHEADREALARTKLLVIDDLGLENTGAKGFMPYLFELVNARCGSPGWTIITTNLPGGAFAARYAKADQGIWERIADRLRQRAVWHDIQCGSLRTR